MELDTVAKVRQAFYRLVGTVEDDSALIEQGESQNDVAYQYLTRGCRNAQKWMLKMGYAGWRQRSSALSWTGTDDTTGGRYSALPADFLRAAGNQRQSALREANGDPWGELVEVRDDTWEGDFYYFRGDELWLARGAQPPTTLYLDYHFTHPLWSSSVTIDFPMDARPLIVAEAAVVAMFENWLPGGPEMKQGIREAQFAAREEARDIARPTKSPRQFRKALRYGNHWMLVLGLLSGLSL